VNRHLILVALLAIFLAACGTQTADDADATLTAEPTAEATSEPTEPSEATDEPAASEDDGGSTGSLDDLIPDDLNGVAGIPIPGMDQLLSGALQQQGLDAGEAEFAFVTYGDDENAVVLNAFRIPGVTEAAMEQLGRLMAGADPSGEFEAETVEIGGKTVLSFSGEDQPGVVYFYVADDVAFTVAGQEASAVEQLLAELP
jgi:hypothetical protein